MTASAYFLDHGDEMADKKIKALRKEFKDFQKDVERRLTILEKTKAKKPVTLGPTKRKFITPNSPKPQPSQIIKNLLDVLDKHKKLKKKLTSNTPVKKIRPPKLTKRCKNKHSPTDCEICGDCRRAFDKKRKEYKEYLDYLKTLPKVKTKK